jgi:hypothetical protein
MIVNESPAASFTRIWAFSDASDEQGPLIDLPEQGVVVDDIPDPVIDFFEPDVLVTQSIAEERLCVVEPEGAAVADPANFHVGRIVRWRDAIVVEAR